MPGRAWGILLGPFRQSIIIPFLLRSQGPSRTLAVLLWLPCSGCPEVGHLQTAWPPGPQRAHCFAPVEAESADTSFI